MKQQININQIAYKKIIYHCLRYPSSKVYGLLTRQLTSSNITNSYPLFHTSIVAPTLSLALDLIQSNLNQNQQIYGFYEFCQQNNNTLSLSRICQTNQLLKNMVIIKIQCIDKKFIFTSNSSNNQEIVINTPSFQVVEKGLLNGQHRIIIDIDAHLDTVQLDFRNVYVK